MADETHDPEISETDQAQDTGSDEPTTGDAAEGDTDAPEGA